MTYAIHIAVVLVCVVIMSLIADRDAFTPFENNGKPSASIAHGGRDHNEMYIPPVHALSPVSHDRYGVPEHLFGEAGTGAGAGEAVAVVEGEIADEATCTGAECPADIIETTT